MRVASNLFYKEGVRAVGIDRIIEESGVAKASFYRNFPTKDSLIVAYLEIRHGKRADSIAEAKRRHPNSPKDQFYSLLEDLVERMKDPGFRGCPFMNAVVEFPDLEHPGHRSAVDNRHRTWDMVEEIAREGKVQNPVELAAQIRILSDGAMMSAYIDKDSFHPDYFLSAARRLIEDHFSR